jgi:hypothetical protein
VATLAAFLDFGDFTISLCSDIVSLYRSLPLALLIIYFLSLWDRELWDDTMYFWRRDLTGSTISGVPDLQHVDQEWR